MQSVKKNTEHQDLLW